jgi:hypothetical protein
VGVSKSIPSSSAIETSAKSELVAIQRGGDLEEFAMIERLQEELAELKQRRAMRGRIAAEMVALTRWWLVGIGLILLLHGFLHHDDLQVRFSLPDSVLIAVVSTTTIAVLGLIGIVVGDLFPRGKRRSDDTSA